MSAAKFIPTESLAAPLELLPLSLLNDYLFCPRRAALKLVEGWRSSNAHTARGDIVHEHADLPGYEVAKGVTLLRALPVCSERLGLNGKCDIVEVHPAADAANRVPAEVTRLASSTTRNTDRNQVPPGVGRHGPLVPIEYKRGKRRQWVNDDAQLCAQALCLEEMMGVPIPRGAIFHAESKRRREVEFTPELRSATESAAARLHELLAGDRVPQAVYKPACEECSLFAICLPKATGGDSRAANLTRALFKTD